MTRAPVAAALAWAACLLVATFLGACSGQAVTGGAGGLAPGSSAAAAQSANPGATPSAAAGGGSDWAHVLQVVASLKAQPPAEPVVCLLGGSAARESTIDDASWAAQVKQLGGPPVAAYNLGSRNRTLAQDIELIRALPKTPGIVYIGINVGRFTAAPAHPTIDLPEPAQSLPPYRQHQYGQSRILGDARKRALLAKWLAERYPLFEKNYATSLQALDKLVATCKSRGLHPVLLELPRNQELIGRALDAPVARYHDELPRAGQEARHPVGELREHRPPAQHRLLRPLAPRRARARRVAAPPLGEDRGAARQVRPRGPCADTGGYAADDGVTGALKRRSRRGWRAGRRPQAPRPVRSRSRSGRASRSTSDGIPLPATTPAPARRR